MSSLRRMLPSDLFKFELCNLDPLTETYQIGFYLEYLAKWPHLCFVMESRTGVIEGYILAKVEASPPGLQPSQWPYDPATNTEDRYLPRHAHITALTVATEARRLGHARKLNEVLEQEGNANEAWFIDLFVREDNKVAIALYESMGYSIFRKVMHYYNDESHAYDMRKPLAKDTERKTIRKNGDKMEVDPMDVWATPDADVSEVTLEETRVCLKSSLAFLEAGKDTNFYKKRNSGELTWNALNAWTDLRCSVVMSEDASKGQDRIRDFALTREEQKVRPFEMPIMPGKIVIRKRNKKSRAIGVHQLFSLSGYKIGTRMVPGAEGQDNLVPNCSAPEKIFLDGNNAIISDDDTISDMSDTPSSSGSEEDAVTFEWDKDNLTILVRPTSFKAGRES